MSAVEAVLQQARRDLELAFAAADRQQIDLTETEQYARDPIRWINDHVWIASKFSGAGDRVRVRPLRMRLFPDQEATIAGWINLDHLAATGDVVFRNMLIDKSRQIGETWALAATVTWLLHYHRTRGLYMHTRGPEVADRGWTLDSFFGRVRFVDERLSRERVPGLGRLEFRPGWAAPAVIENLDSGALVRGECQRDDPGRGSTFDWAVVDEAAHVQHGEEVHAAVDEACPDGKVYLSTPKGDTNVHARLCDEKPAGWSYLRLHWSTHPVYAKGLHVAGDDPGCVLCQGLQDGLRWSPNDPVAHRYPGKLASPWYDRAVIGKTDEQVARELDIDRAGALTGRVYREFDRTVHVADDGVRYDPELHTKLELGWDFGLDCTAVVVCQDAPAEYRVIGYLRRGDLLGSTATPEAVAEALTAYLAELGVPDRLLTLDWRRRIHCVGDPSGQAKTLESGLPFVYAYRRLGYQIGRPSWRYCRTVTPSVASVKRLLTGVPKPLRVCGLNAADFVADMSNNTWPTDSVGNRRVGATTPLDDHHNHGCRAFAYLVVSKWPPPVTDGFDPEPGLPVAPAEPPYRTRAERYPSRSRSRGGGPVSPLKQGAAL